ncbi:MAG: biosynthetic-type acetolactate synthase large subunit [Candidatus Bathyarchaeota archaeon]
MTGAKACIEALKKEDVNVIFGIPGGSTLPIYDELLDSGIRHILVRHEQCAAHMADGYARAIGRQGVCLATSGPGATNLVTGIATAYMDSSPVIGITGQVSRPFIGRDAFQEADIVGITASVTKHNFQLEKTDEIPSTFKAAFKIAIAGRPGPVIIDIPKDIQINETNFEVSKERELHYVGQEIKPPIIQIRKASKLLRDAERPMILVGGGAKISGASQEIETLAELLKAPVSMTLMGKGCLHENHPLFVGMVGMHGRPYTNHLINEADVILAVGCRFSDRTTCSINDFAKNADIIHIDIDPSEIGKNVDIDIPIVGDAKRVLKTIINNIPNSSRKDTSKWTERIEKLRKTFARQEKEGTFVRPSQLLKRLRKLIPPETIVTTDVGQHQMWAALNFDVYQSGTFISSGGLGTMGFGFPAALGAKVAKPKLPVFNLAGDGSFLMSGQELACSVNEKIPVTTIIFNNGVLGMVAQWQRLFYNKRYSGINLKGSPDFVKLAEAYGAAGLRAESYEEFEKAVKEALSNEVTTVIDVPMSSEENVFPMVAPGKALTEILT